MLGYYLISAVLMVLFVAIGWVVTDLMHLSGTAEMIVRMLLMGVAFSLYGLVYWFRQRKEKRKAAEAQRGGAEGAGGEQEIDVLVRDAEGRLAASLLGKEAKLSALPAFFIAGETGAAKTSLFVHSGVEPDLLSGQVYQDNTVIPTRPVNIWLAQKSVFIESGGKLLTEPARWAHLIKRLQPPRFRNLFRNLLRKKEQAPRAVIVVVDCDNFMRSGAEEALAVSARNLNARLGEISQILGIRLPVYVLFSKLDRLALFGDFVGNLTDEEVTQVLGATLPLSNEQEPGIYAEREATRLTAAFDDLFHSLCDKRLPFLAREHDGAKLPAVYEFPREFRKLRNALVRFLVDLGRPSQLRANPFLRGFYFSGVRPIVVKESSPTARMALSPTQGKRGATGFFDPLAADAQDNPLVSSGPTRTRRVPQWLFLGHLFNDVILRDRAAMGASGQSARTEMMRRLLLGCGAAVLLLWCTALTVSFFNNKSLESRVSDAAQGIAQSESGGGGQSLPSLSALERLDTLRETAEMLSLYDRDGAPWSLRWGLYVGHDLFPTVRRLYFNRFHQLLFGSTQAALLQWMRKLPSKPGPADEYKPTYDTLKGYLITTSHHEKSVRSFLAPLLMERWAAGRQVDPERAALARRQFDFYSDELLIANPFSSDADGEAVEQARNYLAQFNATESIYQFIIAEASREKKPVNFNKQFPGSSNYVINNKDIAGAFTIEGAKYVEEAIRNVKKFFGGESWVLGDRAFAGLDPVKLAPELRARYQKDFLANWRTYLAASHVAGYHSTSDAAQKLLQLSGNQSFLLALFCVASTNTTFGSDEQKKPYQPIQFVTPAPCMDHYVSPKNSAYLSALTALQASMDRVAKAGSNLKDDLVDQTMNDATNGLKVTRDIAQGFQIDHEGNVHGMVQTLMEEPIKYAESILGRLGPAQLNGEGKRFCGAFSELTNKYPFNTSSKTDATLDELNNVFRPGDGKLFTFYDSNLKNYLELQNGQFVKKSDSRVQITDAFLRFFNRATGFSNALYKGGSKEPSLTYNMRSLPADGLTGVTLSLDGQVLKASGKTGDAKDFTWPGTSVKGAKLSGNMGGGELGFITYDGLWAAFRFFGDADRFQASGAGYALQWVPRQGQSAQPIRLDSGKALELPFVLDLKGAPPIFQKGYLSGFQCVSDVAR